MYHYRFYIDHKITQDEEGRYIGGDHTRVIDVEADELGIRNAARVAETLLKDDEVIGSMAQITIENPDDLGAVGMHFNAAGEEGRWVVRTGEDSP